MSSSRLCAGIDVSKARLDIALARDLSSPRVAKMSFPNTDSGLAGLCEWLTNKGVEYTVFEASGGYEVALRDALVAHGHDCTRLQATQARYFALGLGMREKSDPIDALCLARMACVRPGRLEKDRGPHHRELVKLMDYRAELVEALRRHKAQMKKPSENEWIDRMRKETLEHLNNALSELGVKIKEYIGKDAALSSKLERACQIKGVGDVVGWTLLAYLPELGELSRKEVAKLAGVAPLANESGEGAKARRCGPGRSKIKAALWMASLTVIRFEEPFDHFYNRLKNKGKHSTLARVAVCRKLLVALNSMEASQSDYNPQMLFSKDSV